MAFHPEKGGQCVCLQRNMQQTPSKPAGAWSYFQMLGQHLGAHLQNSGQGILLTEQRRGGAPWLPSLFTRINID